MHTHKQTHTRLYWVFLFHRRNPTTTTAAMMHRPSEDRESEYEKLAASNIISMIKLNTEQQYVLEDRNNESIDARSEIPDGSRALVIWNCTDVILNLRMFKPTSVKIVNCHRVRIFFRDVQSESASTISMDVSFSSRVRLFSYDSGIFVACTASMNLTCARERCRPELTYYDCMFDHPTRVTIPSVEEILRAMRS
jgi:hypothetical protein